MTPPPDHPRRRRVTVSVDLPAVLVILLVAAFVLLGATIAYGFWTHTLDPGIVVGVVSTMFASLLAGALTAARRGAADKEHKADQRGAEGDPP